MLKMNTVNSTEINYSENVENLRNGGRNINGTATLENSLAIS